MIIDKEKKKKKKKKQLLRKEGDLLKKGVIGLPRRHFPCSASERDWAAPSAFNGGQISPFLLLLLPLPLSHQPSVP